MIELLYTTSLIAILIGMGLPAVQKVQEAARRARVTRFLTEACFALHNYHHQFGRFPARLDDPELESHFDGTPLVEILKPVGWSVTYRSDGSRFELCAWNVEPEVFYKLKTQQERLDAADRSGYYPIYCITERCLEGYENGLYLLFASSRDYLRNRPALPDTELPTPKPDISILALVTEGLTLIYEDHPDVIREARVLLTSQDAIRSLLDDIDDDDDDKLSGAEIIAAGGFVGDLLLADPNYSNLEEMPPVPVADLTTDAGYLFGYDTLRRLSEFYCTQDGVANSLSVKVDAAEFAWRNGDFALWLDAVESYESELDAQTGKSIAPSKARTLKALLHTF